MKRTVKIFAVLLVLVLFLPDCKKNTSSVTACLVSSVSQLKRKIIFTYSSNAIMTRITDYSDSTNVLSISRYDVSYNTYGQVSSVMENLESGVHDSVAFDYSVSSRIRQKKYLETGSGMALNYTRDFVLNTQGYITSDSVYGELPVRKSLILYGYSTYEYDADYNLLTYNSYYPNGTLYFSLSYIYGDTPVKNNSYDIARFSCLEHYGSDYQYVLPPIKKLPSQETLTTNGVTSPALYTYDLDANSNPINEYSTYPSCQSCAKTTYYKYICN
jgi:hypothetical protein